MKKGPRSKVQGSRIRKRRLKMKKLQFLPHVLQLVRESSSAKLERPEKLQKNFIKMKKKEVRMKKREPMKNFLAVWRS